MDGSNNGLSASASQNTTVLYQHKFDQGASCTEAGWTKVDITNQYAGVGGFWHVDDYAGMDPLHFAPLTGGKSLWLGARTFAGGGPLETCYYLGLPGYGNSWSEGWCTKTCIAVTGDLDVSFKARFDSEPSYDATFLEFSDCDVDPTAFSVIDGGLQVWDYKIPRDNPFTLAFWLAGATYGGSYSTGVATSVKVRFRFKADGAWSDEDLLWNTDGATHIDDLVAEGLAIETFEDEAVNDKSTQDWENCNPGGFGQFMALFPGTTILQEDQCVEDLSCMWAALDNTPDDYTCGGHPEQAAVPFGGSVANGLYIQNEIWSPPIPIVGSGPTVNLEFWVYEDLPLDNAIYYQFHVRTLYGSAPDYDDFCPGPWVDRNYIYYGDGKDWGLFFEPVGDILDLSGGDAVQIALAVTDLCEFRCGPDNPQVGVCHSQSPMFDAVKLYRVEGDPVPLWTIRELDQFQDNFAEDGTTTGTARADQANDIAAPEHINSIIPGDSAVINKLVDPTLGLDTEVDGRAAVWCYVAVWPLGQADKTGEALSGDLVRYPYRGTEVANGITWTKIQLDSSIIQGAAQPDAYAVDLNDNLFEPCDTICFFYGARNTGNFYSFAYGRRLETARTSDINLAAKAPAEFTILPAGGWKRGGDILFVDGYYGLAQDSYNTAFQSMGILEKVDQYHIKASGSILGNRLAGRVKNIENQLAFCYKKILWDCGNLETTLGNGVGESDDKAKDWDLINQWFALRAANADGAGLFVAGDDVLDDLANISQVNPGSTGGAGFFRSTYLTYTLTTADHEPLYGIFPSMTPVGGLCYSDPFLLDGGCSVINDFDVADPTNTTVAEMYYGGAFTGTNAGVLSQKTTIDTADDTKVIMAGFSVRYIRDNDNDGTSDRHKFLYDTIVWLGNSPNQPTAAGPTSVNNLAQNYPNPFNPQTTIAFSVKDRGLVSLKVYNVAGELVRTLANEELTAGAYTKVWDGRNDANQPVSSGVYFYKLVANNFTQTKKMVLLK